MKYLIILLTLLTSCTSDPFLYAVAKNKRTVAEKKCVAHKDVPGFTEFGTSKPSYTVTFTDSTKIEIAVANWHTVNVGDSIQITTEYYEN